MSKKIIVTDECIACGACFSVAEFTKESPNGKAEVNGSGIIDGADEEKFEKIMEECPVKALKAENINKKSTAEIDVFIKNNIENFKFNIPTKEDISYKAENLEIPTPLGVPGEYSYNYRSEREAISAARNAVNSAMYSQRQNIINSIMAKYKIDTLRNYYVDEETDGNYFYETRKRASKLLREAADEIKLANSSADIPSDLLKAETKLKSSNVMLDIFKKNWFEEKATSLVMKEMQGQYYTLDYYTEYVDTDDMDTCEYKSGLFGGSKSVEVTKYCFTNIASIFEDIAKDIRDACKSARNEISEYTYKSIKSLVEIYNDELKKELMGKAKKLREKADEIQNGK